MLHQKTMSKHEAANAAAAAAILCNRDVAPPALLLWAGVFQKRQRSEPDYWIAEKAEQPEDIPF